MEPGQLVVVENQVSDVIRDVLGNLGQTRGSSVKSVPWTGDPPPASMGAEMMNTL